MRNIKLLLILALFTSTIYCGCLYTNGYGQYSGGCTQNCKDYSTVAAAQAACDNDNGCGGVTYSYAGVGGNGATNAIGNGWGYQLRASKSGSKSPNKENSWLKSTCPNPNAAFDPCDFTQSQGTYLSGCTQNCKDFSNLNDALAACRTDSSCGGVSFSRKEIGGSSASNAYDGVWGFQLRAGASYINSPNGENSWSKASCPSSSINGVYCQYSKQSYKTFANQLQAAAFADEAHALAACDARSDCAGVLLNNGQFYLTSGSASASTTNTVAYTRGACNVVSTPILFTGCNFTGDQLALTADVATIDLSKYQSLYVPTGKYVRFWNKTNFAGTSTDNKNSIYCNASGFASFIQAAKGIKKETSIQVRDLKKEYVARRKLMNNRRY